MHHVHLFGCASALFDNLALAWQDCVTVETSELDSLPATIERIQERRPDWVVYCGPAAISNWENCAADDCDEPARVRDLARAAMKIDAHLAVISSDRVFAGPRMFHDENDPVAESAASRLHTIEQSALAADADPRRVLVARTNAFGWSVAGQSFAEWIWESLVRHEPVELDGSSFATPILATDFAALLLRCFRARLHGVLHIGGAERASPFRFAQELAAAAGLDRRLVRAKTAANPDEEGSFASRETSLASRRLRHELNASLPLVRESAGRFAEQAGNGYRDRVRGTTIETVARAA